MLIRATMPDSHPLDRSLLIESLAPQHWRSPCSPLYWNAIGPFGGWIAAMLLHAVQSEPTARGDPVALQAQFIGALRQAPFSIHTTCLRQNRTVAFWRSEIRQSRQDGQEEVTCAHATVTLSDWRDTFTLADAAMPEAPPAARLAAAAPRRVRTPAFLARYDFRPVTGAMPQGAPTMDSKVWIRDAEPRTPDARSIAAICDAPFPSIWLRLSEPVMITTIAYNVFFRTSAAGLAAAGDAHLLLDSRCDLGAAGFFDQDTNVWSAAGALLAQTHQLAWFSNQPLKSV